LAADVVMTDNVGGVRAGIDHLVAAGHRRIGYLGDTPSIYTAHQRLLTGPDRVTALFTGNNRLTVGVVRELARLLALVAAPPGARPALVGFDDFELADLVVPTVTVVAQDPARLGRAGPRRGAAFVRAAGRTGGPAPAADFADQADRARLGGDRALAGVILLGRVHRANPPGCGPAIRARRPAAPVQAPGWFKALSRPSGLEAHGACRACARSPAMGWTNADQRRHCRPRCRAGCLRWR
jgi:hypothetical protein